MKTTTYICDKCKKSVGETELCGIDVSITSPQNSCSRRHSAHKDICKECLKSLGIIIDLPADKAAASEQDHKNQKSFEDKFCDMLSDLGVQFEE